MLESTTGKQPEELELDLYDFLSYLQRFFTFTEVIIGIFSLMLNGWWPEFIQMIVK